MLFLNHYVIQNTETGGYLDDEGNESKLSDAKLYTLHNGKLILSWTRLPLKLFKVEFTLIPVD